MQPTATPSLWRGLCAGFALLLPCAFILYGFGWLCYHVGAAGYAFLSLLLPILFTR